MHDTKEQDALFVYEAAEFTPGTCPEGLRGPTKTLRKGPRTVPPLLLAGIDEDDMAEPHVVRGID